MAKPGHDSATIAPTLRKRLSGSVRIGAEWNVHRNGWMSHQPPRVAGPIERTPLTMLARRYPPGVTGLGYTAGRVSETHVTPSQAKDGGPRLLGPGAAPLALPSGGTY